MHERLVEQRAEGEDEEDDGQRPRDAPLASPNTYPKALCQNHMMADTG